VGPDDVEVALFLTRSDEISQERIEAYLEMLSPTEHARAARFSFERDRRQYVVTRALVRTVLSEMHPTVLPAMWRFVAGEHGRPEIAPEHALDLRFNVSHTRGTVVMAVSAALKLGVDIEALDRGLTLEELDAVLAPAERARLADVPAATLVRELYKCWTLKEAYVKAIGTGLSADLRRIETTFSPALGVRDDHRSPVERPWFFALHEVPPDGALLALAVTTRDGETPRVTARRRVPMGEDTAFVLPIAR
jgi:4'-phosphopantetheinyl transferase